MRQPITNQTPLSKPQLISQASQLVKLWNHSSSDDIERLMKISAKKAAEVLAMFGDWNTNPNAQTPAIDAFVGDIYSGLQVQNWSEDERAYAHEHLLILSGLYGGLRACDGIMPYRLEMGYKLPDGKNIYEFWKDSINSLLPPSTSHIINLSAVEYTKALLPYVRLPVITPKFLTVSPKNGQPTFVTVHSKIARGSFARWLIQNQIQDIGQLPDFSGLGYSYDANSSTVEQPVFICQEFGGLGLSVRLTI